MRLDQILQNVAMTRGDRAARRTVLERVTHHVLRKKSLGSAMIARLCDVDEFDPEVGDFLELLIATLSTAVLAQESHQERGSALLKELETAVDLAAQQDRLKPFHHILLAQAWTQSGVAAPVALELSEPPSTDEAADLEIDFPAAEKLLDDLVQQADGDAYGLYMSFRDVLPTMPAAMREGVIEFAVSHPEPVFEYFGCYWLLDEEQDIRRAAARGLGLRLKAGILSAETVFKLPDLRNWMPKGPARFDVDRLMKNAMRANLAAQQPSLVWKCTEVLASLPDGAGAQTIAAALSRGSEYAVALILLKAGHGIKDAYMMDVPSQAAQAELCGHLVTEVAALAVPKRYIAAALSPALEEGLAAGLLPPPGFIDVVAALELTGLRPTACTALDILQSLPLYAEVMQYSAQKRGRLVNESQYWWEDYELIQHWSDDSDEARRCLSEVKTETAGERALWGWLETRREWWALHIARCAVLFEAIDHPYAASCVATALALLEGRAMKKIPIMEDIHFQTIEAIALDEQEFGDSEGAARMFPGMGGIVSLEAEGPDELKSLLSKTGISPAWVDGYLMSVVIAPETVSPDQWLSFSLDLVSENIDLVQMQRFLDILMLRAENIMAALEHDGAIATSMAIYDDAEICAWASGFKEGYDHFEADWLKASLSNADRIVLRQIADGARDGFTAQVLKILSQWLVGRHLKNWRDA